MICAGGIELPFGDCPRCGRSGEQTCPYDEDRELAIAAFGPSLPFDPVVAAHGAVRRMDERRDEAMRAEFRRRVAEGAGA